MSRSIGSVQWGKRKDGGMGDGGVSWLQGKGDEEEGLEEEREKTRSEFRGRRNFIVQGRITWGTVAGSSYTTLKGY